MKQQKKIPTRMCVGCGEMKPKKELVRVVEPANHRQAKANDTYYLLKKTEAPTVIVECGFLSNWEECAKLRNEDYQAKLVWAIQMGILKYLNKK